jgi:hypothetical protein
VPYTRPEPLRGKHRLDGFDCGEESLSAWLLRYSRQAEATGSARVFVTSDDGRVVGYYALAADALLRCATAVREVGVRACVVHALPEARAFYEAFGFEPSPTDSLHLALLIKDLEKFLAEKS